MLSAVLPSALHGTSTRHAFCNSCHNRYQPHQRVPAASSPPQSSSATATAAALTIGRRPLHREPTLHPSSTLHMATSSQKQTHMTTTAAAAAQSVSASGDDEPSPQDLQALCSKPQITVRPVQASDKARWNKLFRDYIIWYKASVPEDVIDLCWQRLMEGGEGNHIGLVAQQEPGGLVVGLAHVLLHRSTWCATHYCYLEDLYVDGEVRAQGVGAALIDAVYKLADERKAPKVYWQTHERNYRARGLYDKVGQKSQFILYERSRTQT